VSLELTADGADGVVSSWSVLVLLLLVVGLMFVLSLSTWIACGRFGFGGTTDTCGIQYGLSYGVRRDSIVHSGLSSLALANGSGSSDVLVDLLSLLLPVQLIGLMLV
jgi:hypothetical protein